MPENNQNLKPKSGNYFTVDDVPPPFPVPPASTQKPTINPLFPQVPPSAKMNKDRDALWQKQINRIGTGNGTGTVLGPPPLPPVPPKPKNVPTTPLPTESNPASNSESIQNIPPYLRYLMSPTLKRATGNPAWVWTVKITTEKQGKAAKQFQEFHLIVCWYQFIIGALGGIAVGLETGFFSSSRLAQPNVPISEKLGPIRTLANYSVQKSSSLYRLCKRALIAGYLFDVIDKNVEEYREQQDWKNMGISGGITGILFGLRGGFRGSVAGSILFAGFGSLAGYQYYVIKQGKQKPSK